jgi:hypothetical protein
MRVRSAPNPFWEEGPIPFIGQEDLEDTVAKVRPEILHTHDAAIAPFKLRRPTRGIVAFCFKPSE